MDVLSPVLTLVILLAVGYMMATHVTCSKNTELFAEDTVSTPVPVSEPEEHHPDTLKTLKKIKLRGQLAEKVSIATKQDKELLPSEKAALESGEIVKEIQKIENELAVADSEEQVPQQMAGSTQRVQRMAQQMPQQMQQRFQRRSKQSSPMTVFDLPTSASTGLQSGGSHAPSYAYDEF